MSDSAKRQTLQKERSFDSSNGRPTKYFKLDRTYSDVVEDELYAPQSDVRTSPQPSSNKNANHKTERIQNTYPQLFHNSNKNSETQQSEDRYWPGMESSIRFDRDNRNGNAGKSQVIADKKQKLSQQPEQSTVSPKEAFLDYTDNASSFEQSKASVFDSSATPQPGRERSNSSFESNSTTKSNNFPTISSQRDFGRMSSPKTITPVRANEKLSPKPVARGQTTQNGTIRSPSGPTKAQAHDNAAANAKIRALYKEESTNSNISGNSDLQSPPSLVESDSEYLPHDSSQKSQPAHPQYNAHYVCPDCQERFDRESALELHSRIHARPPAAVAAAAAGASISGTRNQVSSDHDDEEDDPSHGDKRASTKLGGPHRCDWIIPSTGQVCGTVFSRPYDLVRHQDTIHRAKKLEFRCEICIAAGTQKIFSRNDALVRHMRHVHKKDPPKK